MKVEVKSQNNKKELIQFIKNEFFDIVEDLDTVYIRFLKHKYERYANSLDEKEKEELEEIIEELRDETEENFWIVIDKGAKLFLEAKKLILEKIKDKETKEKARELFNELASNDEAYWYNRDLAGCIAWFEDSEEITKELLEAVLKILKDYYKAKIEEEYFIDTEEKKKTSEAILEAIEELQKEMRT